MTYRLLLSLAIFLFLLPRLAQIVFDTLRNPDIIDADEVCSFYAVRYLSFKYPSERNGTTLIIYGETGEPAVVAEDYDAYVSLGVLFTRIMILAGNNTQVYRDYMDYLNKCKAELDDPQLKTWRIYDKPLLVATLATATVVISCLPLLQDEEAGKEKKEAGVPSP